MRSNWLDMVNIMLIDFCRRGLFRLRDFISAAPWCSGLTCHPVTVEIVGSNPIGVAIYHWAVSDTGFYTASGEKHFLGRWLRHRPFPPPEVMVEA